MTESPGQTISVFAIADRLVSIDEVIAAAHFRGQLVDWWNRTLILDECERRAAELGEVNELAVQSAAEQFRYDRELITAEEAECWLEAHGLTADEFSDYFVRQYWAELLENKVVPVPVDYLSAPVELSNLLRVELLLSGGFDAMARTLGWRYAALTNGASKITPEMIDAERAGFLERTGLDAQTCQDWLACTNHDERWLKEMLALEAAFRIERDSVLTPSQWEGMLQTMRMALTGVDLEILEVDTLAAAREAALCVREDGLAMEEVAREGGYPHRRQQKFVESLVPEMQQKVLCAIPGEILEPLAQGDGFHLWRLREKIEPSLDDAGIRARIEQEIVDRHFSALACRHVRWQPGFMPP